MLVMMKKNKKAKNKVKACYIQHDHSQNKNYLFLLIFEF
jgi:hypothetical protein